MSEWEFWNTLKFEKSEVTYANTNDLLIFYKGMLPDLFREEQGIVVEGLIDKDNNIIASKVYAKHDENYMPESIKKELEKNNQWKKEYKWLH